MWNNYICIGLINATYQHRHVDGGTGQKVSTLERSKGSQKATQSTLHTLLAYLKKATMKMVPYNYFFTLMSHPNTIIFIYIHYLCWI